MCELIYTIFVNTSDTLKNITHFFPSRIHGLVEKLIFFKYD